METDATALKAFVHLANRPTTVSSCSLNCLVLFYQAEYSWKVKTSRKHNSFFPSDFPNPWS